MRKFFLVLATVATVPLAAQNVDIEALSGLQFNFGNPGARSLGMGGAFLGLADDASAAESNPAGLTILRKPEVSLEVRNYLEQQLFSTSGTFPDVEQTAFTHHSNAAVISFGSFVYPIRNKFTIGVYYHEPLNNEGAGVVAPTFDPFTGDVETLTPNFFLPADGGSVVTEEECEAIREAANDPAACFEYRIDPFVSALSVRQRTFGVAGAWQVHPRFSLGVSVRHQRFQEGAFTFRFTQDLDPASVSVQTTADDPEGELKEETDVTFGAGFKWSPTDKISIGGVYKQGPAFTSPTWVAAPVTGFEYVKQADTVFHMPDVAGLGVSFRPIPVLTINVDAVHVKYTNLVDDFFASISDVRDIDAPFGVDDVTEIHVGGEYFFATKIPFAIRAGYWRDPAHSIEWRGPLNRFDYIAEALLYPEGEDQNHFSIGAGLAWPRFQIDAAYDTSKRFKVGSISVVTRF